MTNKEKCSSIKNNHASKSQIGLPRNGPNLTLGRQKMTGKKREALQEAKDASSKKAYFRKSRVSFGPRTKAQKACDPKLPQSPAKRFAKCVNLNEAMKLIKTELNSIKELKN